MDNQPRIFSLEEANATLEIIRPLMAKILEVRERILARQPEVWPMLAKAAGNGGNRTASQVEREFERLDNLVRQVRATGAVVKDLNTGLVDFPYRYQDRVVYLCWKYGEAQIAYWHEVDAGFAGRQPLE